MGEKHVQFRMDFTVEVVSYDKESGQFDFIVEPDPRRYERREENGERYFFDGFDNLLFKEETLLRRVLLSHSSVDANWVKWIAANARQVGIDVYLYEHDPQPGRLIAEKLQGAIGDSDALVVLLTSKSQFSPYVQQEVGAAKALRKPVIPLVQPGVREDSLAMLRGVEYIPFDFNNPQHALTALLAHLQGAKHGKEAGQALLLVVGAFIVGTLLFGGKR